MLIKFRLVEYMRFFLRKKKSVAEVQRSWRSIYKNWQSSKCQKVRVSKFIETGSVSNKSRNFPLREEKRKEAEIAIKKLF